MASELPVDVVNGLRFLSRVCRAYDHLPSMDVVDEAADLIERQVAEIGKLQSRLAEAESLLRRVTTEIMDGKLVRDTAVLLGEWLANNDQAASVPAEQDAENSTLRKDRERLWKALDYLWNAARRAGQLDTPEAVHTHAVLSGTFPARNAD